jgi:hypothetical protein
MCKIKVPHALSSHHGKLMVQQIGTAKACGKKAGIRTLLSFSGLQRLTKLFVGGQSSKNLYWLSQKWYKIRKTLRQKQGLFL